MIRGGEPAPVLSTGGTVKIILYTLFILVLQAQLIPRLPYTALRTDLMLPLMFGVAVSGAPFGGLLWAAFWGFAVDNFSGEFWGLHVGTYMVAVCLVHVASEKFDCYNPLYQMGLVGLCALGQSVALGLFLSFVPMDIGSLASIWISLGIRTLLSISLAPLLIYPMVSSRNY